MFSELLQALVSLSKLVLVLNSALGYYLHLLHPFVTFKVRRSCKSETVGYEHFKMMTSCEIPEIQSVLYTLNFTPASKIPHDIAQSCKNVLTLQLLT